MNELLIVQFSDGIPRGYVLLDPIHSLICKGPRAKISREDAEKKVTQYVCNNLLKRFKYANHIVVCQICYIKNIRRNFQ